MGNVIDITELKRLEMLIQESQAKYRAIFEATGTATLIVEEDTTIIMANKECFLVSGYSSEELIGTKWTNYVAPESLEIMLKCHKLRREEPGKAPRKYEVKLVNKNGEIRDAILDVGVIPDTKQSVVSMLDITEHKRTEDALKKTYDEILMRQGAILNLSEDLMTEIEEREEAQEKIKQYHAQLRNLVSQMALIEENERRRIANVLHDSIGQNLALSKILSDELREAGPSDDLSLSLGELTKIIDEAINSTRNLTFEISSPILYELGVEAAIEWLGEKRLKRRNILFEFRNNRTPKPLTKEAQVLLFQAVREFYLNIIKHSKAHHVRVFIQELDSNFHISIEDDGIGFDTKALHSQVSESLTYGFFSVRERISLIGGSFEIESAPGQGTCVTLIAPLAA